MKTKLSKILYDKGWTEMELSRRTGLAQSYINRVKRAWTIWKGHKNEHAGKPRRAA